MIGRCADQPDPAPYGPGGARRAGRIPQVWLLAAVGVALGVTGLTFHITRGDFPPFGPVVDVVTDGLAGFLFLACGTFAHVRRPDNRVGLLMVLVGVTHFAEDIQLSVTPWVKLVGLLLPSASVGSIVHLGLAFPTGELSSRVQRILVAVGYAVSFGIVPVTQVMLAGDFGISDDVARYELGFRIVNSIMIGLTVGVVTVLLNRWRTATPPVRRLLTPVFVTAILGGAAELAADLRPLPTPVGPVSILVGRAAVALFPVLFLIGVLRVRMGRTAVAELLAGLRETTSAADLRTQLARTLGDPSLQIGYWRGDGPALVDADGAPLPLPYDDGRRAVTIVEWDGRTVAALIHDAAVSEDRHVLEAATTAAGLALEHQRLTAVVRAQLAEVRASRARIAEAADAERRRLERDLHDGVQQRLVTAALTFGMAGQRLADDADPEVAALLQAGAADLQTALRELRELARGIHPGVLTEAGLVAALEAFAERAPLPVEMVAEKLPPLPSIIEATAYFVAAEALTNVVKHAGASHVRITVRRTGNDLRVEIDDDGVGGAEVVTGGGLQGLADRVAAADGELDLTSHPGAGTHLGARLPTW